MRAISIKQPWAWLISHGYKDCENRGWAPKEYGEILIHASKQFDTQGYHFVKKNMSYIKMPGIKEFEQGGIVGKATLYDVTTELRSKWHQPGCKGLYLKDQQPLPFMPCKGQLSIFEVDYK